MMTVLAVFMICVAGGAIPFITADVYLVGASALVSAAWLPALIIAGTAGQVVGKLLVYHGASVGLTHHAPRLRRLSLITASGRRTNVVVFLSALTSVPPFHVVALTCGVMRTGYVPFALASTAGRFIRTALICLTVNSLLTRMFV